MISKINLKIVGYLLSAIFLYLAFKETDIKMIIQYMEYTNFLYIFISFFLITAFYFFRSLYQQNNLRYLNSELSFPISLQSIAIVYFFNSILPARLGEIIRVFFLAKNANISKVSIMSYILLEKIIDVIFIFFMLFIMAEINSIAIVNSVKVLLILLFVSIIFIFIFFYFNKYLALLFKYILPKKYHQVVSRINIDFHRGLNCFRSIEQTIKAIIFLFIGWILVMLVYYLVSLPYLELLGLPKYSFLYFFVFTALALAIPSAPAGIGVVHYGLFLSVSILNPNIVDTNIDLVAAFVISLHFFVYLIAIISSGFIILFQNWKYNFYDSLKSYYDND